MLCILWHSFSYLYQKSTRGTRYLYQRRYLLAPVGSTPAFSSHCNKQLISYGDSPYMHRQLCTCTCSCTCVEHHSWLAIQILIFLPAQCLVQWDSPQASVYLYVQSIIAAQLQPKDIDILLLVQPSAQYSAQHHSCLLAIQILILFLLVQCLVQCGSQKPNPARLST